MSIKDSIASLRIGDHLMVDDFHTVEYAQKIAKQNGQKLVRWKQWDGSWLLRRVAKGKRSYRRLLNISPFCSRYRTISN